ncbi:MAG: hypothetical protein L6R40_001388 [Gallowayella cf. fulva]|nr:MAG: hypothetical protein L6R40_001388 [Xanthomendoza cf. fulva]
MITFIRTDNAANDDDFALYKNSRFKECAASNSNNINCTLVMTTYSDSWKDEDAKDRHHYVQNLTHLSGQFDYTSFPSNRSKGHEWCSIVSCLRGFKVIPSSPLPSAFDDQTLAQWLSLCISAIAGLWRHGDIFIANNVTETAAKVTD